MGEVLHFQTPVTVEEQLEKAVGAEYLSFASASIEDEQLAEVIQLEEIRNTTDQYKYEQSYEDTATWLAETIDGPMRTSFDFYFDGEDIVSEDGRAMRPIFKKAIQTAEDIQQNDPRLAFEVRRRKVEQEEHSLMIGMMKGDLPNTMIVISDFPTELESNSQDISGYNLKRRQTMLRVVSKKPDGSLNITTQSLDMSDRRALESIYKCFGVKPGPGELLGQRLHVNLTIGEQESIVQELTDLYDNELTNIYGGSWRAGTKHTDIQNTYEFVKQNEDILREISNRAASGTLSDKDLYNAAALIAARKAGAQRTQPYGYAGQSNDNTDEINFAYGGANIDEQLRLAGEQARQTRKVFSGCGVSLSATEGPNDLETELDQLGYGNDSEPKDKFGSLSFECPKGHKNTRPKNELIDKCKTCGTSVKCEK